MRTTSHRHGLYAPELLEARIAPATFVVMNLADTGDGSLRDAIDQANMDADMDTITFDKSVKGPIPVSTGELLITHPVKIKGPGADVIQLDAGGASRVFEILYSTASTVPTTISGLGVFGGSTTLSGGGLLSVEATVLDRMVFAGNTAHEDGGGAKIQTFGKVVVTKSQFINNEAEIGSGGGLVLTGLAGALVSKSTFIGNHAQNIGGLRVTRDSVADAIVDGCTIAGNIADESIGGIAISYFSLVEVGGKTVLKNSVVSGNRANGGFGTAEGISVGFGTVVIDKTTVSANTAAVQAGGIYASKGNLTIKNSRIVGNQVTTAATSDGGGIVAGTNATLLVQGSLVAGNVAGNVGGGFSLAGDSVVTIKARTISGNIATNTGGGIYAYDTGDLKLIGTKILDNIAGGNGGGVAASGVGTSAVPLFITGGVIAGNRAASGGGILAGGDGPVTIAGTKILGNIATGTGGGVYLKTTAAVSVTSSLFARNFATVNGGGLAVTSTGTATATACHFIENIAGLDGGGISTFDAASVAMIKGSVIGNLAVAKGGGIFHSSTGTFTTEGTKIALNTALLFPQSNLP